MKILKSSRILFSTLGFVAGEVYMALDGWYKILVFPIHFVLYICLVAVTERLYGEH